MMWIGLAAEKTELRLSCHMTLLLRHLLRDETMPPRLTTQEFIDRARAVHGDKYGYAFSVYQQSHTKVYVHCEEHGVFTQTPSNHLRGQGCPGCFGTKKHTTESFIQKAREVHGDSYDYAFVNYVHSHTKVKIICRKHGSFLQTPSHHLNGVGCPGCAKHGFDRTKAGFLYVLRSDCGQYMKIGITNKPDQRHTQLSRTTPFSFECIEMVDGNGELISNLEKELLAEYQTVGFTETFDGSTEWRLWNSNVVNQIKQERLNDY